MPQNLPMIRVKVLDYWIDRKNKKAYCIQKFIDFADKPKKSNVILVEREYHGK